MKSIRIMVALAAVLIAVAIFVSLRAPIDTDAWPEVPRELAR